MLVNVNDVAAEFGCTDTHVQQLVKAGMPKVGHGKYDLEKCKTWYIHHLKARLAQRAGDDTSEYNVDRESARLKKAQAELAEIELAAKRGALIPISEFGRTMAQMVTQARQNLLQMPGRVAHELEGEDRVMIKHKLIEAVHKCLNALARGESNDSTQSDA